MSGSPLCCFAPTIGIGRRFSAAWVTNPSHSTFRPRSDPWTSGRERTEGLTELFACSDVPLTARVQSCCHTNTRSAQQEAALMLQLARNNKLAATVVALLVSVSAAGMSVTTARGASEHPPVIAVAVLPEAARLQRKRRYAAGRVIRRRLVRRARANKVWSRRRRLNLRPRLPVREWYARGPPR